MFTNSLTVNTFINPHLPLITAADDYLHYFPLLFTRILTQCNVRKDLNQTLVVLSV